ncbi:unnamed protein product, partial [Rotaria sp. Silwood1]
LYDPSTGLWTVTCSMNNPRYFHKASVLSNGKVLITGGNDGEGQLKSVELYDPSTETWTLINNMNTAREYHTATILADGKVLITGGHNGTFYLNSAELYDPSSKTWTITYRLWTVTCSMNNPRYFHKASVLSNGKVLITGGNDGE